MARVGHARAGAAGDRRPTGRPAARPRHGAGRRAGPRGARGALEPHGPAAPWAAATSPAPRSCWLLAVARRRPAARVPRRRQRPRRDEHPDGLRHGARAFGPGANGPLLLVARRTTGRPPPALAAELATCRASRRWASPRSRRAGGAAVLAVTRRTSPQDPRTEDLITRLREDVLPDAGVEVLGGRHDGLVHGPEPRRRPSGCRCSSAASSGLRSCSSSSRSARSLSR